MVKFNNERGGKTMTILIVIVQFIMLGIIIANSASNVQLHFIHKKRIITLEERVENIQSTVNI